MTNTEERLQLCSYSTAHGLENAPANNDQHLKYGDKVYLHKHAELSRSMGLEVQIPLAPLPREGSVSGAQKGTCLPAFEGAGRNMMPHLLRAM